MNRAANALQFLGALGVGAALYLLEPVVLLLVASIALFVAGFVMERH